MKQQHITLATDDPEYGMEVTVTIHPKGSGRGEDFRQHDSYFRVSAVSEFNKNSNDFVSFTDSSVAFTKSRRLKKFIKNEIAIIVADEILTKTVIAIIEANV